MMMVWLMQFFLNPLPFQLPTIQKPASAVWAKFGYATVAAHIEATAAVVAGVLGRLHNPTCKRHSTHFTCGSTIFWTLNQTVKHRSFIHRTLPIRSFKFFFFRHFYVIFLFHNLRYVIWKTPTKKWLKLYSEPDLYF